MDTKKYNCINCCFHTNLTADYTRHKLTKKHLTRMNTEMDYVQEYDNIKTKYDSLENNSNIKIQELESKINEINKVLEETNVLLETKNEIQSKSKKNLYESNDEFSHLF